MSDTVDPEYAGADNLGVAPVPEPRDFSQPAPEPAAAAPPDPFGFEPDAAPAAAPAPADDFGFVPDHPADTRLRAVVDASRTKDPGRHGQVVELARASGAPEEVVDSNLDGFKSARDAASVDYTAFRAASPVLAQRLVDHPEKAPALAHDIEPLSGIERWMTGRWEWRGVPIARGAPGFSSPLVLPLPHLAAPTTWGAAMRDAFVEQEANWLQIKHNFGMAGPYDARDLEVVRRDIHPEQSDIEDLNTAQYVLAKAFLAPFKMAPMLLGNATAMGAGFLVGGPIGAAVAGAGFNAFDVLGPSYEGISNAIDKAEGPNGEKVGKGTAKGLALGAAALQGVAYQFGFGWVGKQLAAPVLEAMGVPMIRKALSSASVWRAIGMGFAKYGYHVALGAATVAVAQSIQMAAEQAAATGEVDPVALAKTGADHFVKTLPDMLFLSAAGAPEMFGDIGQAREAVAQAGQIQGMLRAAKEAKSFDTAPSEVRALLAQMGVQPGATDRVYFSRDAWDKHWSETGANPREVAASLIGDGGKAYDEAKATGGDVVVPIDAALTKLARAEQALPLWGDARLSQDTPSIRELGRQEESFQATVERFDKEAAAAKDLDGRTIYDQEKAKALAGGASEGGADLYGKNRAAFARSFADRYGGTPMEWHQKFGQLNIIRGPGGASDATASLAQLDRPGPVWYSAAERAVDAAKQAKGNADSWAAVISKAPGVKKEELDATGLNAWLKTQKGTVTREAVKTFLQEHQVEVSEKVLGEGTSSRERQDYEGKLSEYGIDVNYEHDGAEFTMTVEDPVPVEITLTHSFMRHMKDEGLLDHGERVRLEKILGDLNHFSAKLSVEDRQKLITEAETLAPGIQIDADEGGSSFSYPAEDREPRHLYGYDEIVSHMRNSEDFTRQEADNVGSWIASIDSAPETDAQYEDYTLGGHKPGSYREILFSTPKAEGFNAPHFSDETAGLLAHARVTDHETKDGKRVLMVEEVQSDLHQQGRERGYIAPEGAAAKAQTRWESAVDAFFAYAKKSDMPDPHEVIHALVNGREPAIPGGAEGKRLGDEIVAANKEKEAAGDLTGVPDAPFKSNWEELVAKRMIRWAAENGYDGLVWPTGEQQAERYGLERHIGSVTYSAGYDVNGQKSNSVLYAQRPTGASVAGFPRVVQQEDLSHLLGKELADKLLAAAPNTYTVMSAGATHAVEDERTGELLSSYGSVEEAQREADRLNRLGARTLGGLDLKVGGEGMRFSYDKKLPSIFEKLVKKDGGKVGTETLKDGTQVHSVTLPDTLRERALREGFPLFQEGAGEAKAQPSPPSTPGFAKWFRGSKVVGAAGEPVVVYHGTSAGGFEAFDPSKQDKVALKGPGFYFTEDPSVSSQYSEKGGGDAPAVYPVYLSIKNPFRGDAPAEAAIPALKKYRAAAEPPADIKRMIDSAMREDSSVSSADGIGSWIDNTEWAYLLAEKAGKNGEELVRPYFDYILEKAAKRMVKEIRAGDYATGDELLKHIENNVFDKLESHGANIQDVLQRLGFDGITHIGGNLVGDGSPAHRVWVAFKPEQIKSPFNEGGFDASQSSILKQPQGGTFSANLKSGERGYIEFSLPDGSGTPRRFDLHLLETADETTLAHELMHFMGEALHDIASQPDAPAGLKADYATLVDFMGYSSGEERAAAARERVGLARKETRTPEEEARLKQLTGNEEKLAHAWEQYLAEGKAPSAEMAGVFRRFSLWAKKIYGGVQGIAAQFRARFGQDLVLSDDVRRVFDRMLATDEEIASAQGQVAEEKPPTDLLPGEQARYDRAVADEADQGRRTLLRRITQDQARETKAWFKAERKRIAAEVDKGLEGDAAFRALAFFQEGEVKGLPPWVDAELKDETGEPVKLDRAALEARYGPYFVNHQLPSGVVEAGKREGVDADFVAEKLGFSSGDEMLMAIVDLKPATLGKGVTRARYMAQEVKRRMDALYGPALLDDAQRLKETALDAVHNDAGAERVVVLMEALRRQLEPGVRRAPVDRDLLRRTAGRLVDSKAIGDLSPDYYLSAERSAAKRAFDLAEAGKMGDAYDQREAQLLAREMWRAARDQREVAEKAYAEIRRGATAERLGDLGKGDPAYRDAYASILAAVGIGEGKPDAAALDVALTVAAADAQEIGFDSDALRSVVAAGAGWKNLTVADALNVRDALKNLRRAAERRRGVELAGRRESKEAFFQELGTTLKASRPAQPLEPYSRTAQGTSFKLRHLGRGLDALLTDMETLAEMMDGDNRNGPAHRLLIDSRLESRGKEVELVKRVLKSVRESFDQMPKEVRKLRDQRVSVADLLPIPKAYADRIAPIYTRDTLWSLFLNWGNEGNRQRIRDGNGWTDANVEKALGLLHPGERSFLQGVLDTIDTLYPELAAAYEQRTGLVLPKVSATPIVINGETHRGGYFPLKYDSRFARQGFVQTEDAIASLFAPNYIRPSTPSSHTKARVEKVPAPVDLTWGTVPAHLAQVIHDIAYRDWVVNAGRIMLDERWRMATTQFLGPERAKEFTPWLRDVANARADSAAGNASGVARELGTMGRSRLAVAAIALNIPSLAAHTFDPWTTVIDGVAPHRVANAYARTMNPAGDLHERAVAVSPEMQYRDAMFRDNLRHTLASMGPRAGGLSEGVATAAFKLHEVLDRVTTTTAWTASFEQALADGKGADEAVSWADDRVRRSFPSHDIAEKPPILRTKSGMGAVVTFYGYASKLYNLNRRGFDAFYRAWTSPDATPVTRTQAVATVAAKMIALSVIGTGAAFFAGRGPDPEENKLAWILREVATDPINTLPFGASLKAAATGGRVDVRTEPGVAMLVDTIHRLGAAGRKLLDGDVTHEDKAWTALELAVGLAGPVGQAHRTIGYGKQLYTGETQPRGPLDLASGLVYGKRGKQPLNPATAAQNLISGR